VRLCAHEGNEHQFSGDSMFFCRYKRQATSRCGAQDKRAETHASAAAANSIGSTIAGWSFSGVLTLVGIGPQARRGTATSGHADLRAGGEQQRVAVRWRTRHPSPAATTPLAPARFSVCGPSRATGRLLRGDGRTALRRRDVRAACGIRVRRHSAQCFLGVGRRAYPRSASDIRKSGEPDLRARRSDRCGERFG